MHNSTNLIYLVLNYEPGGTHGGYLLCNNLAATAEPGQLFRVSAVHLAENYKFCGWL